MSSELCFRKGGVDILSIGTGHPLAMAFIGKPCDKWAKMKETEFNYALEIIHERIDSLNQELSMYNRVLEGLTNWEDRFELAKQMNDTELEIEHVKSAIPMVKLLHMIWEEGRYTEKENILGLEWGIF